MGSAGGATYGMGSGGIGLSSCASAWSGAAVTNKKDRHLIAPSSLSNIFLVPQMCRVRPMRLTETPAELGRSSGQNANVGEPVARQKDYER
jgi:hypothetical protein